MKLTNLQVSQAIEDAIGHLNPDQVWLQCYSCDALGDSVNRLLYSVGRTNFTSTSRVVSAIVQEADENNQVSGSFTAFDEFERGQERQEARALWLTFLAEWFEDGTLSVDEINRILSDDVR